MMAQGSIKNLDGGGKDGNSKVWHNFVRLMIDDHE